MTNSSVVRRSLPRQRDSSPECSMGIQRLRARNDTAGSGRFAAVSLGRFFGSPRRQYHRRASTAWGCPSADGPSARRSPPYLPFRASPDGVGATSPPRRITFAGPLCRPREPLSPLKVSRTPTSFLGHLLVGKRSAVRYGESLGRQGDPVGSPYRMFVQPAATAASRPFDRPRLSGSC